MKWKGSVTLYNWSLLVGPLWYLGSFLQFSYFEVIHLKIPTFSSMWSHPCLTFNFFFAFIYITYLVYKDFYYYKINRIFRTIFYGLVIEIGSGDMQIWIKPSLHSKGICTLMDKIPKVFRMSSPKWATLAHWLFWGKGNWDPAISR